MLSFFLLEKYKNSPHSVIFFVLFAKCITLLMYLKRVYFSINIFVNYYLFSLIPTGCIAIQKPKGVTESLGTHIVFTGLAF